MQVDQNNHIANMRWNFDNTYARLPSRFYTAMRPVPVREPRLVIINHTLASELGLDLEQCPPETLAQLFAGNLLPDAAEPLAQAYAGHQFGHFTMLGDGRAHLLGEHLAPNGSRMDIQFKGSGKTPYSRQGDGRATLGPMLREYIISEAMQTLGIPTTRSLAVLSSGEPVYRQAALQGAILTRVAASHLRVGTFQYLAAQQDIVGLKLLADYTIERHYSNLKTSDQTYLDLIKVVMQHQIALVTEWLRVGFIHGVMNTDNMSIAGETIDYGPCAFMDNYDPQTVFSSIDHRGRYAYANQPNIARWNLARFAEALLPLLHTDMEQSLKLAEGVLESFNTIFQTAWLAMMRRKLGLFGQEQGDKKLMDDLLQWMQDNQADYTNTFRDLSSASIPERELYQTEGFRSWRMRWQQRLEQNSEPLESAIGLMLANNPAFIPRNHRVEAALSAAEGNSDFTELHTLLQLLAEPYQEKPEFAEFQRPPSPEERVSQTFCGT